jgi:hypothetical protein
MLGDPRRPPGATPSPSGPARIPQIAPRRPAQPVQPQPRAPSRTPRQPYINHSASLASLARHLMMGIDKSKLETTVKTHELVALLEHVITIGFGSAAAEKMAAELKASYDAATAANEKTAAEGLYDGR